MIISFFGAFLFLKIALGFKLGHGPELILEATTDVGASDSPEATPGSALHRLGNARRNNARQERGPRRRMRLKSVYTSVSTIKFDDAGDCRARRGAARSSFNEPFTSEQACPPPVF